ncbi:PHP domain-containing protein [Metabacillus herbersteinensis]|uniref:PHP domain-containing protein n=1 Tax=Metabacillus herbersteinensis TaxID=283816 RepID=A0ABV6GCB3_9BACI
MKIDLHCHTKISDNSYTIQDVLLLAKKNRVSHLAITDHDTTLGLESAIKLGNELGITVIPGIEISAYDFKHDTRAHILGLYIKPGHEAIEVLCQPLVEKRNEASYQMVKKLIAAGYDITWKKVQSFAEGGTGVYKQHIMHALLEKGYTDRIYGELYKKIFFRGNETQKPGIGFVPIKYINAIDAIRAIRVAGGIPVLAHPGQFNNFEAAKEWAEIGLEGIEVKHPLHSEQDEAQAREIAETYNLVQTGGSDFHGFYGDSQTTIGSVSMEMEHLKILEKRKEEISMRIGI